MRVLVGVVAALGVLFAACVFYPGYMSVDSIVQLSEARSGHFTDLHPPIMALLMRGFDRLSPGPQGYMLFQLTLFWVSLVWLMSNLAPPRWAAALSVFVGLAPPVFALVGTIWKDVLLGALLLAATAMLWRNEQAPRRAWLVGTLVVLFLAMATRHNALVAVVPLLGRWSLAAQRSPAPRARRWTIALAITAMGTLTLWVASRQLGRALTEGKSAHTEQQILIFDTAAVSIARNEDLLPSYFHEQPGYSFDAVQARYRPQDVCPLVFCPGAPCPTTNDAQQRQALQRAWLSAISSSPREWLRHRWHVYRYLLSFNAAVVEYPFHHGVERNTLGVEFKPNAVNRAAMLVLEALRNSLFFRGWVYVLTLALFALVALHRRFAAVRPLLLTTSLSGLGYALAYFFIAPVSDFRLLWWSVVAAWVCLATVVAVWVRQRASSVAPRAVPAN